MPSSRLFSSPLTSLLVQHRHSLLPEGLCSACDGWLYRRKRQQHRRRLLQRFAPFTSSPSTSLTPYHARSLRQRDAKRLPYLEGHLVHNRNLRDLPPHASSERSRCGLHHDIVEGTLRRLEQYALVRHGQHCEHFHSRELRASFARKAVANSSSSRRTRTSTSRTPARAPSTLRKSRLARCRKRFSPRARLLASRSSTRLSRSSFARAPLALSALFGLCSSDVGYCLECRH